MAEHKPDNTEKKKGFCTIEFHEEFAEQITKKIDDKFAFVKDDIDDLRTNYLVVNIGNGERKDVNLNEAVEKIYGYTSNIRINYRLTYWIREWWKSHRVLSKAMVTIFGFFFAWGTGFVSMKVANAVNYIEDTNKMVHTVTIAVDSIGKKQNAVVRKNEIQDSIIFNHLKK